jgi:hypothetical protein
VEKSTTNSPYRREYRKILMAEEVSSQKVGDFCELMQKLG